MRKACNKIEDKLKLIRTLIPAPLTSIFVAVKNGKDLIIEGKQQSMKELIEIGSIV